MPAEAQYWGGMSWCDGQVAVAGAQSIVLQRPGRSGAIRLSAPGPRPNNYRREVAFSPDCSRIAVVDRDRVGVVDIGAGTFLRFDMPPGLPRVHLYSAMRGQPSARWSPSGGTFVVHVRPDAPNYAAGFGLVSFDVATQRSRTLPVPRGRTLEMAPASFAFVDETSLVVTFGDWGSPGRLYRVSHRGLTRISPREVHDVHMSATVPPTIVATRMVRRGQMAIASIDPRTGDERVVSRGHIWLSALSSDGTRVTLDDRTVRPGGGARFAAVPIHSAATIRFSLDPQVTAGSPAWDLAEDGAIAVGHRDDDPLGYFRDDGVRLTAIPLPTGHVEEHHVSPDGRHDAFLIVRTVGSPRTDCAGTRVRRSLVIISLDHMRPVAESVIEERDVCAPHPDGILD